MTFVDSDRVCQSNLNRQIIATYRTLGMLKVEAMAERAAAINPYARIFPKACFFTSDTCGEFDFAAYDYVIDAIDTVSSKLVLAERCREAQTPLVSCMGAGNKLDPGRFQALDIYQTSVCPLARVMRSELRKRGIQALKVVCSTEPPLQNQTSCHGEDDLSESSSGSCRNRRLPGSNSFVPAAAGLVCAREVILDLAEGREQLAVPR